MSGWVKGGLTPEIRANDGEEGLRPVPLRQMRDLWAFLSHGAYVRRGYCAEARKSLIKSTNLPKTSFLFPQKKRACGEPEVDLLTNNFFCR